jgi:hypothetical protein
MLQNLLADRFKLVLHKDTKPVPAVALTIGKDGKAKMKEASGEGAPGCQPPPPPATPPDPNVVPYAVAICHGMTMEVFAQTLRGIGGGYVTSPVVDLTGLKGSWDFELKWTPRALLARAGSDGITLFDAVDKQLGLKLEQRNIPSPVLVVDSANQKPSDNPSGIAQNLPLPPPAEFDVADVKLSLPDARRRAEFNRAGSSICGLPDEAARPDRLRHQRRPTDHERAQVVRFDQVQRHRTDVGCRRRRAAQRSANRHR